MPEISVIIPVFNTEKYVERCIESVLAQEKVDFEVIIVNDGSTDNSELIIKRYEEKYPGIIKYFSKSNGGLSDARNFGVGKATGKYLCFVDSDDYIDDSLFKKIKPVLEQEVDLIKYKCIRVEENCKEIERIEGPVFDIKNGEEAFNELYAKDVLIEPAWLYLYKRNFYVENEFKFPIGKFHEDWAIVPYILIKAQSVVSTNIFAYYYVQSSCSITRNNNDEKIFKRACDMLEHYDYLSEKIEKDNIKQTAKENFKIYMSNCLILKLNELPKQYHKIYIKELKKRKIINNFKVKNIKQLIKKAILKINISLYLKIREK